MLVRKLLCRSPAVVVLAITFAMLTACAPVTRMEALTEHNPVSAKKLKHVLLIAAASDGGARRSYENRCDSYLSGLAQVTSSHEIWPAGEALERERITAWLATHPEVDSVLVVQLAGLEQQSGRLHNSGAATRELQLMEQPGLTWNYQPDPSLALPDHPTALTQTSLYLMPDRMLALTLMARTDVDGDVTSLFRSHCKASIGELQRLGWLP